MLAVCVFPLWSTVLPNAPAFLAHRLGTTGRACRSALPASFGLCHAAEEEGYVSQEYIDTVIQRAYTNFNTAMTVAGTGFNQEEAIEEAKAVVKRLKDLSKDDVNRNYILWKVSELEYQILLEEREIQRKAHEKKVGRMNELVDIFNAEIGKKRPDFVKLDELHRQFKDIDPKKAAEIRGLITSRSATVSRQVLKDIQNALAKGDIDRASKGLDYCYANQEALKVSPARLAQIREKVGAHLDVSAQKSYIEEDIVKVSHCLGDCNLRCAWRGLGLIDRRLGDLKRSVAAREYQPYIVKRCQLQKCLDTKEDSLVDKAITIYNSKGRAAAADYVDIVMRSIGVSQPKLALVDQAIMGAAMVEAQESTHDPELRRVFVDLVDETNAPSSDVLSSLGDKAKKRAQERQDSIKAAQEKQARIAREEWERNNRRRLRREARARRREERRLAREERRRARREARARRREERKDDEDLALGRKEQPSEPKRPHPDDANRQIAQRNIVLIYSLLENNDIQGAYERFTGLQEPLKKYLIPEAYSTLEATVMAAYREADAEQ